MQNGHGLLGQVPWVQISEGKAALGVHDGLKVNLAHPRESGDVEGTLTWQAPWRDAFPVSLPKAGIGLLSGPDCSGFGWIWT